MVSSAAFRVSAPDLAATAAIAGALAGRCRVGDVIGLQGDLGAGKTEFARAMIRRRAGRDITVPSPTYTLLQRYDLPGLAIWHFDLYRLKHAEEIWELGWEEALADGLSLVEWPERAGGLLPADRLTIAFTGDDAARRLQFDGAGDWAERLVDLPAEVLCR